jgi:hypothetical protein
MAEATKTFLSYYDIIMYWHFNVIAKHDNTRAEKNTQLALLFFFLFAIFIMWTQLLWLFFVIIYILSFFFILSFNVLIFSESARTTAAAVLHCKKKNFNILKRNVPVHVQLQRNEQKKRLNIYGFMHHRNMHLCQCTYKQHMNKALCVA